MDFCKTTSDCNFVVTQLSDDIVRVRLWHASSRWFTEAAKESLVIPNAGGNSQISEAISINMWQRYYAGCRIIFETAIRTVWARWPIVDFVVVRRKRPNVGVSVVRAMHYLGEQYFDEEEAVRIMTKKLNGLIVAQRGCYQYSESILHVICQSERIAVLCKKVLPGVLDMMMVSDTLSVLMTVCEHSYVYHESPDTRKAFCD